MVTEQPQLAQGRSTRSRCHGSGEPMPGGGGGSARWTDLGTWAVARSGLCTAPGCCALVCAASARPCSPAVVSEQEACTREADGACASPCCAGSGPGPAEAPPQHCPAALEPDNEATAEAAVCVSVQLVLRAAINLQGRCPVLKASPGLA